MVLDRPGTPLDLRDVPQPELSEGQLRVRVECCAVCRTDLHVVDGELRDPKLPLVPGHQIAGVVEESRGEPFARGARVGIPWLGWTCGVC